MQGVRVSFIWIKEKYESPYVVYQPEWYTYIQNSWFNQAAVTKLAVDKVIS